MELTSSAFPPNFAIIGGTGFEKLPPEYFTETITISIGDNKIEVLSLSDNYMDPHGLYFLPRHGREHRLAPHQIDYRANIQALLELRVGYILASNAVGSLRSHLPPGTLLCPHDFIDFTRSRPITYFEGERWKHTDFSSPYSSKLRQAILQAGQELEHPIVSQGVYLCTDGPRFETPAEIRMFAQWGADVVGMTGAQEAIFAREVGIEYATLCAVTNYAAGLTSEGVEHALVTHHMQELLPLLRELLLHAAHIAAQVI